MNSIRVVLSVVVALENVTEQLDANTAFLNSDLKERVYKEVPYGINNTKNMAASAWHKTIHRVFVRIGFRSCGADVCDYVKVKEGRYVYVCLYVDDMIIAAKTGEEIQEVKTALKNAFKMKELGEVKFTLGMEIDHDYSAKTLAIRQMRYIDDVVNRFNQKDPKVVANPCEAGLKLTKTQSPKAEVEFLSIQGKLYRLSLNVCCTSRRAPDRMWHTS
ncbi:polyprotein [Phytophthora megakarya]|uniref:Polyprotein n=1 Tax=Phytophthora megakarya TaxID=4795 RepID=A0A225VEH2_9STRA|nr:polyprotein [Phytophthora megakarya]